MSLGEPNPIFSIKHTYINSIEKMCKKNFRNKIKKITKVTHAFKMKAKTHSN